MSSKGIAIALSLVLTLLRSMAAAQPHDHPAPPAEKLGRVHFETSCAPAAQPIFDRAVALLHSFDFGRAIDGFNATLATDSSCAMAHWGIAISHWGNPFAAGLKSRAQLQQGLDASTRGVAAGARTDRERAYINAVLRLFADADRTPQQARLVAYRDAMAGLAGRYPKDDEAAAFFALAVAAAADPADKSYADLRKAGTILETLFARYPNHPGLAHYIIHAYDVPPLADRALRAARQYSTIAPSAPHALHMPSHTFTRVGSWQESIDTNIASAAAARREKTTGEELHATDYQMYAYLQTAQDSAARRLLDALPEMASRYDPAAIGGAAPPQAAYFALAAVPARYALERGAWTEALALEPRPSPFPFADAITHLARALGAARTGRLVEARESIDALRRSRQQLTASGETYWAEQVEVQRQEASAWLAFADGRQRDGLAELRAAAEHEDATEKNAVTPGPLAPAREQLGEMLLEAGDPAAALKEFEATLQKEPNRFRALAGAARAAAAAGDRAAARRHAATLLRLCARADTPGRPELLAVQALR